MTARQIDELEQALGSFAWIDPHTHLDAMHLTARGLDDIVLYHMSISDLYAAGCPDGDRIPEDRDTAEGLRRMRRALPYLQKSGNTFIRWGVNLILRDLYGIEEPIQEDNLEALNGRIAERFGDEAWGREVRRRANISRSGTELWRGHDGRCDDILQYALEWAFFARTQWGQPDISLYELERAWNASTYQPPLPVTLDRSTAPPFDRTIRTVDDVQAAIQHYCDLIPYDQILATAQHISTDIDYVLPDAAAMQRALAQRASAGDAERDIYASFILNAFLAELELRNKSLVFQFSFGAEALPYESASRLTQRSIGQLAGIISRYPGLKFQCFLSSRHANQALCTLARELPNFSLAGYWWHNFFSGAIRQVMEERLDMLPTNRQIGFFSDAYCFEWTYAKMRMVRRLMAEVLNSKIELGQYSFDDAVAIARAILVDASVELLGMKPAPMTSDLR